MLMIASTLSDGGTGSAPADQDAQPTHCLYLLVCADPTGPRTDTFKLGISSRLAQRYHKHTLNWRHFDLSRSVLFWARDRHEVQCLESAMRHVLGDAGAAGRSRAVGETHRPDGSPAPPTYRRDPGRRADGHTEFYSMGGFHTAVAFIEGWRGCRAERAEGSFVQRGIDPADLLLGPGSKGAAITTPSAARLKAQAVTEADITEKVAALLDLALDYEANLRSVGLSGWRKALAGGPGVRRRCHWLLSLYFAGFGPAPKRAAPAIAKRRELPCAPARRAFMERFKAISRPASGQIPTGWQREVISLDDLAYDPNEPVENLGFSVNHDPDTLAVQLRPYYYEPTRPFLARFEALARRVEARG